MPLRVSFPSALRTLCIEPRERSKVYHVPCLGPILERVSAMPGQHQDALATCGVGGVEITRRVTNETRDIRGRPKSLQSIKEQTGCRLATPTAFVWMVWTEIDRDPLPAVLLDMFLHTFVYLCQVVGFDDATADAGLVGADSHPCASLLQGYDRVDRAVDRMPLLHVLDVVRRIMIDDAVPIEQHHVET